MKIKINTINTGTKKSIYTEEDELIDIDKNTMIYFDKFNKVIDSNSETKGSKFTIFIIK